MRWTLPRAVASGWPVSARAGASPNSNSRSGLARRTWSRAIVGAAGEFAAVELRAGGVEASQGREIGRIGGNADGAEHALRQHPAIARQRPSLGAFLRRGKIGEQHQRRAFDSVGQDSPRAGSVERQAACARQPGAEGGEVARGFGGWRFGDRSCRCCDGRSPAPVARRLADRDIDPRIEPPAERAERRGAIKLADVSIGPTHAASSTKVDGAVKELAGQSCRSDGSMRRGELN